MLPLKKIFADTSDDVTLFAVAPWQGIPQLLLKSLNLTGAEAEDHAFRVTQKPFGGYNYIQLGEIVLVKEYETQRNR